MAKQTGTKRFGDVFNKVEFPDCRQVDLIELLGVEMTVKDVVFKQFRHGTVAIIKCRPVDEYFAELEASNPELSTPSDLSTLCGGAVVVEKLQQAKEQNMLPMIGTISKEQGQTGLYYDIR